MEEPTRVTRPTAPAPLTITMAGSPPVLSVLGELDMSNTDRLADAIRSAGHEEPAIALDLEGLSFIDSTGIRTLLLEQREMRAQERDLVVVSASPRVRRVLEIIDVWRVLAVDSIARS